MSQQLWEDATAHTSIICKQCHNDNLISFATFVSSNYQFEKDLTNSDIKSLKVKHKKENINMPTKSDIVNSAYFAKMWR